MSYFRLVFFNNATSIVTRGDRRIRTSEVETTDLQSVPFGHSGISPLKIRAEEGTRTPDLLITNQWLYQLSYFGLFLFDLKERPLIFGIANLVTFFVVAKKNKTFFAFFQKYFFDSRIIV